MTVTTFSELELDESLLDALGKKVSLARQLFRQPPFHLRSMAVMYSVLRRQAPVKRRHICCQCCSTCSTFRAKIRSTARFNSDADP